MTLRTCTCPVPLPQNAREGNPGREDWCRRCLGHISKEWTCNAQTIDAFLDRLEASLPGEDLSAFREHVVVRELAGRERFGHSFLGRQNCDEGLEEACDLALYSLLDSLRARREGRGDEDWDLVLTAAAHAFHAHSALRHLKAKRAGAP